jgi:hypothetical protein
MTGPQLVMQCHLKHLLVETMMSSDFFVHTFSKTRSRNYALVNIGTRLRLHDLDPMNDSRSREIHDRIKEIAVWEAQRE